MKSSIPLFILATSALHAAAQLDVHKDHLDQAIHRLDGPLGSRIL